MVSLAPCSHLLRRRTCKAIAKLWLSERYDAVVAVIRGYSDWRDRYFTRSVASQSKNADNCVSPPDIKCEFHNASPKSVY
jgi:hypothetical protein